MVHLIGIPVLLLLGFGVGRMSKSSRAAVVADIKAEVKKV